MPELRPAQISFESLADLPLRFQQGQQYRQQRDLQNAFSNGLPMSNGAVDFNAMAQMFAQHGDPSSALGAAKAADASVPDIVKTYRYFQGDGPGGSASGASGLPRGVPGVVADQFKSKAQLVKEQEAAKQQVELDFAKQKMQTAWPRVQQGLSRLRNVLTMKEGDQPGAKPRFTTEDFDWGLGPNQGDEQGGWGSLAARKLAAAAEPIFSDSARGVELRDTILGESAAVLKIIQPLVRTKGEGSQSDIEFKVIADMVGNLTKSRGPDEYKRRVADIEGRIANLMRVLESEPDVTNSDATNSFDPNQVIDNGDGTGTLPDGRKVRWVE